MINCWNMKKKIEKKLFFSEFFISGFLKNLWKIKKMKFSEIFFFNIIIFWIFQILKCFKFFLIFHLKMLIFRLQNCWKSKKNRLKKKNLPQHTPSDYRSSPFSARLPASKQPFSFLQTDWKWCRSWVRTPLQRHRLHIPEAVADRVLRPGAARWGLPE